MRRIDGDEDPSTVAFRLSADHTKTRDIAVPFGGGDVRRCRTRRSRLKQTVAAFGTSHGTGNDMVRGQVVRLIDLVASVAIQ